MTEKPVFTPITAQFRHFVVNTIDKEQNMQKKNWVVMKITHRASQYGNLIEEVLFANGFGEMAYTYLDKTNDNYRRWQRIVDLFESGAGVIVTGLKPKAGGKRTDRQLVSADSAVKIQHATEDISEVLAELVDLLDSRI